MKINHIQSLNIAFKIRFMKIKFQYDIIYNFLFNKQTKLIIGSLYKAQDFV